MMVLAWGRKCLTFFSASERKRGGSEGETERGGESKNKT